MLNRITTWERNSTLKYIPKRTGNLCSQTNVDTNVHSSINHNSKELVTTHIINWWLDKQNIVYSHTGILFRKKELPTNSRGWGGENSERPLIGMRFLFLNDENNLKLMWIFWSWCEPILLVVVTEKLYILKIM